MNIPDNIIGKFSLKSNLSFSHMLLTHCATFVGVIGMLQKKNKNVVSDE